MATVVGERTKMRGEFTREEKIELVKLALASHLVLVTRSDNEPRLFLSIEGALHERVMLREDLKPSGKPLYYVWAPTVETPSSIAEALDFPGLCTLDMLLGDNHDSN